MKTFKFIAFLSAAMLATPGLAFGPSSYNFVNDGADHDAADHDAAVAALQQVCPDSIFQE